MQLRNSLRKAEPDWHNAPVPTFGSPDATLLVVGLAPGLRGANRTGRPFTGDYAGDLLYETLIGFGFAAGKYEASPADGLRLISCAVTNALRCVPPQNKPAPAEVNSCRPYLAATIACFPRLRVIVALGRVAHESVVRSFAMKPAAVPFAHGSEHVLTGLGGRSGTVSLIDSYHCSRYNTNTGVLTREMFRSVFAKARARLKETISPR